MTDPLIPRVGFSWPLEDALDANFKLCFTSLDAAQPGDNVGLAATAVKVGTDVFLSVPKALQKGYGASIRFFDGATLFNAGQSEVAVVRGRLLAQIMGKRFRREVLVPDAEWDDDEVRDVLFFRDGIVTVTFGGEFAELVEDEDEDPGRFCQVLLRNAPKSAHEALCAPPGEEALRDILAEMYRTEGPFYHGVIIPPLRSIALRTSDGT